MGDLVLVLLAAGLALLLGDRIGWRIGCAVAKRCMRSPLIHVPLWLDIPIALLIPLTIIASIFGSFVVSRERHAMERLADNLELLMLGTFFATGIIGGFFSRIKKR